MLSVVGEVWNAWVRHEDGGGKDRPVLVWRSGDTHVDVLKITSRRPRSSTLRHYLPLPPEDWCAVLARRSWLELTILSIPHADLRCPRGYCPDQAWERIMELDRMTGIRRDGGVRSAPSPARRRAWSALGTLR